MSEKSNRPGMYCFWAKLFPVCYSRAVQESSLMFWSSQPHSGMCMRAGKRGESVRVSLWRGWVRGETLQEQTNGFVRHSPRRWLERMCGHRTIPNKELAVTDFIFFSFSLLYKGMIWWWCCVLTGQVSLIFGAPATWLSNDLAWPYHHEELDGACNKPNLRQFLRGILHQGSRFLLGWCCELSPIECIYSH